MRRVHIGQAVPNLKGTIDYFIQNTFNCPTLAEAYKIAGFAPSAELKTLMPVILPPGRLRLSTSPRPTGSSAAEKTIGVLEVAFFAANADGGPPAARIAVTPG